MFKIGGIVFLCVQLVPLIGAEGAERLEELHVSLAAIVALPFGISEQKTELEEFEAALAAENQMAAFDNDQVENDGTVTNASESDESCSEDFESDHSLYDEKDTEIACPFTQGERKLEGADLREKRASTICVDGQIKRRARSVQEYCEVCDVWFRYRDKEGRHKKRKPFCEEKYFEITRDVHIPSTQDERELDGKRQARLGKLREKRASVVCVKAQKKRCVTSKRPVRFVREYCETCEVWFSYRDKEGRHKKSTPICDGSRLRGIRMVLNVP